MSVIFKSFGTRVVVEPATSTEANLGAGLLLGKVIDPATSTALKVGDIVIHSQRIHDVVMLNGKEIRLLDVGDVLGTLEVVPDAAPPPVPLPPPTPPAPAPTPPETPAAKDEAEVTHG